MAPPIITRRIVRTKGEPAKREEMAPVVKRPNIAKRIMSVTLVPVPPMRAPMSGTVAPRAKLIADAIDACAGFASLFS